MAQHQASIQETAIHGWDWVLVALSSGAASFHMWHPSLAESSKFAAEWAPILGDISLGLIITHRFSWIMLQIYRFFAGKDRK